MGRERERERGQSKIPLISFSHEDTTEISLSLSLSLRVSLWMPTNTSSFPIPPQSKDMANYRQTYIYTHTYDISLPQFVRLDNEQEGYGNYKFALQNVQNNQTINCNGGMDWGDVWVTNHRTVQAVAWACVAEREFGPKKQGMRIHQVPHLLSCFTCSNCLSDWVYVWRSSIPLPYCYLHSLTHRGNGTGNENGVPFSDYNSLMNLVPGPF